MKPRSAGKLWFRFPLHGLDWEVRRTPKGHPLMKDGKHRLMGHCFFNARCILIADYLTHEQLRVTFAHELQHAIEDAADVDYEVGVEEDVHDRWTDNVARGWLYVMRHSPTIVGFLQGRTPNG